MVHCKIHSFQRAERGGAEVIEKEFANSHEKAQRIALERFRSATVFNSEEPKSDEFMEECSISYQTMKIHTEVLLISFVFLMNR